ncbi:RNA polymerase sigma factor [Alloacidobacterium dinghuense]|uniref:RNA polymerase sigma factor n=1 Tax=Alloacidobacterium dinghuense TaxID=2763107 RepID=A0A7G8BN13_9BACT|nr:RNA polymerase sigma factor [Alloacidobacterium dinghuense]QNI33933.1 RNA polymerase sigma factor [Alloacidobacterium dinghuense]
MTLAESITNYAGSAREVSAQDEAAFQLIYDATARPLWAYLLRVSGRSDVADDLLQETYCRFLGRKNGRSELAMSELDMRRYLFRIATNLLRDRWRKHESDQENDMKQELAVDADPAAKMDVERMLRTLKPRARQLLWLAYVEGLSHAEIAEVTGLSVLSIRLLLFRARRSAAGLLQSNGRGMR